MKLKTKVRLTLAVLLVIAILIPLLVTVQYLTNGLHRELAEFEREEVEKLRDTVKNFVDLGHEMINLDYQLITNRSHMARVYGETLRAELDIAIHYLKSKSEEAMKTGYKIEQAKVEAKEMLKSLRLQGGVNYIWVQDNEKPFPKMIVHPLIPELDGKFLDDPNYNCARGKGDNLFVAGVEVAEESPDGGFIDYLWPKLLPDGSKIPSVAKVSFVKKFPEWNWILGTGIYIDDAVNKGITSIREDISRMRYNGGNGFFWLHDKKGTLLCHGNSSWLEASKTKSMPNSNIIRGLKLIKDGRSGEFFEFKGTSEEFGSDDDRVAYIKFFEPLNWVIGTSISRATIDLLIAHKKEIIKNQINRIMVVGSLFFLFFTVFAVFIIGRILGPFALLNPNDPTTGCQSEESIDQTIKEKISETIKSASKTEVKEFPSELMKTLSEITRHTVSEQSKLLALQVLLAGNAASGDEMQKLSPALQNSLQVLHDDLKNLAGETEIQSEKLENRLSAIENLVARPQNERESKAKKPDPDTKI